jgi:hypothetical protein
MQRDKAAFNLATPEKDASAWNKNLHVGSKKHEYDA